MISSGNDIAGMDMTSLILPDFNQQTESVFSYFGKIQILILSPTTIAVIPDI
jgi:hypothetical protein